MVYVACSVVRGEAHPAAADEIAEAAWCTRAEIIDYIPEPFSKPVQEYLAERLK
jgi:8-oxo-dGTP diphosphatase